MCVVSYMFWIVYVVEVRFIFGSVWWLNMWCLWLLVSVMISSLLYLCMFLIFSCMNLFWCLLSVLVVVWCLVLISV